MKRIYLLLVIIVIGAQLAQAQGERKPLQLSGLVVEGDSMLAIPGAYVFVPASGRGGSTNLLGYFSFPVLPGDSVVVAAVGFKKKHFVVANDTASVSMVIHLIQDTILLPLVEIRVFPIEKVFKEAFLAMEVPDQGRENMYKNLNDQIMERLLEDSEMDASLNHKYYMQQQINAMETRYLVRTNPFLDPFSWARFFKSVKENKQRKEAKRKKQLQESAY